MDTNQGINYFEIVQCITNILTCVGVLFAAFEFVKSYRYKIKIRYNIGSIGLFNPDMSSVKSEYGFIINKINRSVFDISINSVSIRFGKKGAFSLCETGKFSSYSIAARNNHKSYILINDGIIDNFIIENNIDRNYRMQFCA